MMTQQFKQEVNSDSEDSTRMTGSEEMERAVKSAPGRLDDGGAMANGGKDLRRTASMTIKTECAKDEEKLTRDSPASCGAAPPSRTSYMTMFPSLPHQGATSESRSQQDVRDQGDEHMHAERAPHDRHLESRNGNTLDPRSRGHPPVPPSFGQAVHRFYTKDIKRSTSPDPYLYEANLSR